MAGITISGPNVREQGLRPVNLRTDLPELADLIETAFSSTMDSGGRAAIREMRQLSRLGVGLGVLSNLNELAQGMSLGFVWVESGRIVGNVSVYPADYPREMGRVWIIANVAVYPEYRGRGIATRLMNAILDMIQQKSGGMAVLQVDLDNNTARHMYRKLGFREERAWSQWRRGAYRPLHTHTQINGNEPRIVQRRMGDTGYELALAQQVRPQERGGVDWLRPTHINTFRLSVSKRLSNWLNLRDVQRLVIRDAHNEAIESWLQIESAFGVSSRQLTLLNHPLDTGTNVEALIGLAVRRYGYEGINMNHPHEDQIVSRVLRAHQFSTRRQVMHMRYTFS
ncbi:MAG: GNAT family N-acetyltransferase [Chloroflexota bacterium]